jgi:RNA polymerase sigma-70 factor (ECF subfamily)
MEISKQQVFWVLRAQCHDREALELLFESVQGPLLRYLSGVVGPAEADDVLQEVLVLAFRKLRWLQAPELFRPWLFRIASRAAFRQVKRRRQRFAQEDDSALLENVPAAETLPPIELRNHLALIDGISPASRAVLALHFEEEMSLPDVAAVLEIPLGTVKSRLAYGLLTLRKHLGNMRRL